jgi:cation diffusion facilitator family transporter
VRLIQWCQSVRKDPKASIGALSVVSNTILVAGKFVAGFLTGSVSIIAEAIHSTMDLVAALIAFVSVRIASQPADDEHRYGHGKAENIAGSVEAVLIFVAAIMIMEQAIKRIINGGQVENAGIGVAVMAVATVVNLVVSRILLVNGRKLESVALEADGMHLLTDVYTSVGVLVGMVVIWVTGMNIWDPIIAIIVSLLIVHAAYDIFAKSFQPLMDASLSPEEEEEIIRAINIADTEGLIGYHALRTRRAGSDRYVDMHLVFRTGMSIDDVHVICDEVEFRITASLPTIKVLIHAEPCEELKLVQF